MPGSASESRDRDRPACSTGATTSCRYRRSSPSAFAKCLDENGEFHFERWGQQGKPEVNPLWLLKYLPNMPASHIAIYNDLRGPNNSITVREASAGAALAEAYSTIHRGHADVLVVGSTGSRIHPLRTLHASMQEKLASNRDDPRRCLVPLIAHETAACWAKGAGAIICETLEARQARGAKILGELVGYGSSAVGNGAEPIS